MLEVQYEDLVADFEVQARRIVDYCGLEWDSRCLSFYETKRRYVLPVQHRCAARFSAVRSDAGGLTMNSCVPCSMPLSAIRRRMAVRRRTARWNPQKGVPARSARTCLPPITKLVMLRGPRWPGTSANAASVPTRASSSFAEVR